MLKVLSCAAGSGDSDEGCGGAVGMSELRSPRFLQCGGCMVEKSTTVVSPMQTVAIMVMAEVWGYKSSGGMNGYISLCGGEPCPPIFRSCVAGMEDIKDNHVLCAIYRLPDAHKHISRPPQGVKFPKKTVTIGDVKAEPVLWHEDSGRRHHANNGRKNPPKSISGRELGDAAHRLVVNSLQAKFDNNGYHHRSHNGPHVSYPLPMDHRLSVSSYGNESRPGHVPIPPISAPSLEGRPQFAPCNTVPTTQQVGGVVVRGTDINHQEGIGNNNLSEFTAWKPEPPTPLLPAMPTIKFCCQSHWTAIPFWL
ncbi:unnamed protein product [Sphenostylis stenocarpa]|uniref:Xrn1 helical domain-containing protein n=1 Tax=Sphenostylis stenocarpa TaxID=92480 RepID=A0AA86S4Y3_9FABA|nr:unnamed protein product [Sphenostylis stenocarpa]